MVFRPFERISSFSTLCAAAWMHTEAVIDKTIKIKKTNSKIEATLFFARKSFLVRCNKGNFSNPFLKLTNIGRLSFQESRIRKKWVTFWKEIILLPFWIPGCTNFFARKLCVSFFCCVIKNGCKCANLLSNCTSVFVLYASFLCVFYSFLKRFYNIVHDFLFCTI